MAVGSGRTETSDNSFLEVLQCIVSSIYKEPEIPAPSLCFCTETDNVHIFTGPMQKGDYNSKETTCFTRIRHFTGLTECLLGSLVCHMVVPSYLVRATRQ